MAAPLIVRMLWGLRFTFRLVWMCAVLPVCVVLATLAAWLDVMLTFVVGVVDEWRTY